LQPVQPPVPPTTVKLEYRRKSDGELQGSIEFLIYSFDTFETLAQTIIDRPYDSQEMNYRLLGGRADAWTFIGLAFRLDYPGAVETGITGNTEEEATRALKNACRVIHRENELGNKYQYTMIAYFEEH
jgi:hypothetical protein